MATHETTRAPAPDLGTGHPPPAGQPARPARPAPAGLHRILGNASLAELAGAALTGPGAPVPDGRRAGVERATEQHLGDVRLHTGPRVRVTARALGAAAFTVGRDIAVATRPGQPVPQALLEHELVHAAQQRVPGTGATPEQAEAQAAHGAALTGRLAGPGGPCLARAAEDWLETTPNVRGYGYSELVDELREVNEWLGRQIESTPATDRMREARAELAAELARRQRAIRQPEQPPARQRRQGPAAPAELPPETEAPRVLRERASTQLTDPAEVRAEVDRITAWLQRPDVSRADRAALRQELAALAPQLETDLAQASATRQAARLAAAFQPADAGDRAQVLESVRLVESIRPYAAQPGTAYVVHRGEMLVFPQSLADQVRAGVLAALRDASRRAAGMNSGTEFRLREHLRLNYEEQPLVGFAVSLVSGEEPVDVQARVLPPLAESAAALANARVAERRGALAEMVEAVFTAVERADRAQLLVLEGIERSIAAAGQIVRGLEITRDLAIAVALSVGAILAAPIVAAGVAGLGATGAGATALTALGTGTVVGAEGLGIGFLGGGLGELAAGADLRRAARSGLAEGVRVGEQGFAIGLGGGASLGLARNLGLGTAGLTRTGTLWRNVVAQGTGNAIGSATGALLTPLQPGGPGRLEAAGQAGLLGLGLGAFGGVAGTYAAGISSPVGRLGVGLGLPSLAAGGATYWQTGDIGQSALSGGSALAIGALGLLAPHPAAGAAGGRPPEEQPPPLRAPAGQPPSEAATAPAAATPVPGGQPRIRLLHGTEQGGLEGMQALGEARIDVAYARGEHQDLGRGFYLTLDTETALAYSTTRAMQRGQGRQGRYTLAFEVPFADLGDVVDIRRGGNFRAQWEAFLTEPPFEGLPPISGLETNRGMIRTNPEQRGVVFDRFLARIGKQSADTVFAPLGDDIFTGIVSGTGETTQISIRSQRIADRLNEQIRTGR